MVPSKSVKKMNFGSVFIAGRSPLKAISLECLLSSVFSFADVLSAAK